MTVTEQEEMLVQKLLKAFRNNERKDLLILMNDHLYHFIVNKDYGFMSASISKITLTYMGVEFARYSGDESIVVRKL